MAKKIIGAFIFNNNGDGCLTGKWLNNDEPTAYPEAAKWQAPIDNNEGAFCGKYITTWIEQGIEPIACSLEIRKRNPSIYDLKWISFQGNTIFYGTAMLYNEMLIGSYWQ